MTVQAQGRPWRGMSPQARDAARRDRLLAAGLEVFGTTGYQSSTVTMLCRTAKVSTRSFYEIFSGREELLAAVYLSITDEIRERMNALTVEPDADVTAWIAAAVDSAVGPMLEDERKGLVAEIEVVGVSPEVEEVRRAANTHIAAELDAVFDALVAQGLVAPFDTGMIARFAVGGVTESLVVHLLTPARRRRSREEFVAEMARIFVRMLTAPSD